ncbi:MAG: hypothetical protein AAF389_02975 [Gemmatimonadota bacterium]
MSHRNARLPLLLSLVLLLGGCVTWQPVTTSAADLLASEAPERVRVTTTDGSVMTLYAPAIRAGAIVGTLSPGAALLDDITLLEVEQANVLRTIALTVPAAAVVGIVALVACRCT